MSKPSVSQNYLRPGVEYYQELLETLNVIPWEFHLQSQKFLYVGPQACLFGYPAEDWYEPAFLLKIIHPEDVERALAYCLAAAQNNQDYEYEYRMIKADGEFCWVRKIVKVLSGAGDSVILRGIFVDISAQKLAEERLVSQTKEQHQRDAVHRDKNDQFDAAINHMSQGLSMFDSERRLIVCNSQYAALYHLPPELTRPGTPLSKISEFRVKQGLFSKTAHKEYIDCSTSAIDRGEMGSLIQQFTNGEYVETAFTPMVCGGWLSTHEDITERKQMVNALYESEEFLSIVFRLCPVSMTISDPERGTHIEVNDAWSSMLGYTYEEGLENTSIKLNIWCDQDVRRQFIQQISEEGAVRDFEARLRTKDGRILDVLMSGEMTEIKGKLRNIIATHDITDRKKIEQELMAHSDHLQETVDAATMELKQKAEELEQALSKERELSALQRQFVSMASHEFRTPLAIIDGAAQRLTKLTQSNKLTPQDAIERFRKIRDSVQRMTALMESTLGAAQMAEGKINIEIGPCCIAEVVTDVCLRQQEISRNHIIRCSKIDLPDIIQADTGALEQVLTNLLSNAVKYAPDAPDIEVNAYRQGNSVVVSVRDFGIGIDEEELFRIGERFFRAKTSTGIPGTGIGLNLSKKLLEMHGGTIRVESVKSSGSTFFMAVPIEGPVPLEDYQSRAG